LAAVYSSGFFKATNGADRRSRNNAGLSSSYVNTIVVDAASPSTLTAGDGLLKSTDGVASWISANGGFDARLINVVTDHPSDSSTTYIRIECG
jgi:hypothetical protein